MSATITRDVIAEIYDGLGDSWRAELLRYVELGEVDPNEATAEELLDDIEAVLDEVPEMAASAKHTDTCWRKHAACLVDRLRESL